MFPHTSPHTPYHFTPVAQRRFVAVLAESGSVGLACQAVSMSRVSAYRFRKSLTARAFAIGWDAALLIAQAVRCDAMLETALTRLAYTSARHPETGRLRWRLADPALGRGRGLAHLRRLDRACAAIVGEDRTLARAAMGDFELFLGLIERGGDVASLARFFAANGGKGLRPFLCNLTQKFAAFQKGAVG